MEQEQLGLVSLQIEIGRMSHVEHHELLNEKEGCDDDVSPVVVRGLWIITKNQMQGE